MVKSSDPFDLKRHFCKSSMRVWKTLGSRGANAHFFKHGVSNARQRHGPPAAGGLDGISAISEKPPPEGSVVGDDGLEPPTSSV
jgi:hypothetical protein